MIQVRNLSNLDAGVDLYLNTDAFLLSICKWYDENEGECDLIVDEDDRLIKLLYIIYEPRQEADTSAVIIKDELPEDINVEELIQQLKTWSC